jgi:hypothetical protein
VKRAVLALTALLLLGSSALGRAQELSDKERDEEASAGTLPHWWTVELRMTTVFYPDADSGAPNVPFINAAGNEQTGPPFYDVYGPKHRMLTDLEVDRDLWQGFGSVAVGLAAGYSEFYGYGMLQGPCPAGSGLTGKCFIQTDVNSSFHIIPARLLATYRFDYYVPDHIPVVPFVRAGLDWFVYWNAEQSGQVSYQPAPSASDNGIGLVTGVEVSGGLEVLLDDIDAVISRDALHDLGIAHTYLMAEYVGTFIQNGPSNLLYYVRTGGNTNPPAALNLSAAYFQFGLGAQF